MYLFFAYAHKASFGSIKVQPYLKYKFEMYRVLKPWQEQEATAQYQEKGLKWNNIFC